MRRLALLVALLAGWTLGRAPVGGGRADAEPSQGPMPDFADMVARAEPAIVYIHTYLSRARDVPASDDRGAQDEFLGSGFVWGPDGWILTNRHVVDGAREILCHLEGRGWFQAGVRGVDPVADVAVLKIEANGLPTLPLGNPRAVRKGQWVVAAGSPYRLPRTFTAGIVSGLERSDVVNPTGYEDYIQTDAAINLGNSGGPLLDAYGRVVGLNTAILSRSGGNQGIGFAVPIDVVAAAAEQIRTRGTVVRATLGAVVRPLTPREGLSVPTGMGLVVTRFADDSPARRSGIREGDVILRANGAFTPSRGILLRTVWATNGQPMTIELWRGGQVVPVTVQPVLR
jgi:S1-C subfamily serine protease